jgi:hypothetical protein
MSDDTTFQTQRDNQAASNDKDQAHIIEQAVDPHHYHEELQKHVGDEVDPETQKDINKPLADQGSKLSGEDEAFLKDIIQKIDSGQIDLYKPASILNQDIYDGLSAENQARTDLFIQTTLGVLRQIYNFDKSEHPNDSYMMQNMIHELRVKKETLENEIGDVLII